VAEAQPPTDELYPAAYRLARLYAILSPRVLIRDLNVDRERAEALLVELERHGAVGPTVIKGTGARESRVNVVEDEAPGGGPAMAASDPRIGWRMVVVGVVCALVGLGLVGLLTWLRIGDAVNAFFMVELGSPILAAVIRCTLPSFGLLVGYLVEWPLRRAEDFAPYWAIRAHGWIWNAATLAVVLLAVLRLLSR
jgi:hypothetical protein